MDINLEIETVSYGTAGRTNGNILAPSETAALMRIDVDRAMRALSPRQQDVCRILALGHTQTEAGEFLKCSRTIISKEMSSIRRVFRRFHLDDYVTNTNERRENDVR
jgi:DNA-binding CsgD family transcriptional regulator